MSSTKLQQTNPKCQIKSTITDDLSDPVVEVKFSMLTCSCCHNGGFFFRELYVLQVIIPN